MKRDPQPEWLMSKDIVSYKDALSFMDSRVKALQKGAAQELLWALEHPSLYTLGTSAKPQDVLNKTLPAYETGRGGEVTYHGPGQRVVYVMLDLSQRTKDIRAYVQALEDWILLTLKEFGVDACRREGRIGLWVPKENSTGDNKIAAIGVRVSKWVTFHGIALNVNPDLSYYQGIIPCGIRGHGVTSLHELGVKTSLTDVDKALQKTFSKVF